MKKLTLLLICALCLQQCSSQKITTMQQNNDMPSVSIASEVFDTNKYEEYRTNIKSTFIRVKLDEKKYYEMTKGTNQHHYLEFDSNSYFHITKVFYPNNNIKFKGASFNNSFQKGIWYYYNEDGSFSHEIDYDALYKFTWEDIMQYCKDNRIILEKGYVKGGWITRINRSAPPAKPEWVIEHYVLGDKGYVETIILDGVTGKEVKRTQRDLPGE